MSELNIQVPGVFGENDNFLLERELGQGGMGGVYMGRDKMLDRPVAVKVMLKEYGDDLEFVEKFKKEAQACARLIHPNIAQIYSYGICAGMPYMAMELAAGGSLYTIMQAAPGHTDIARVIKICQQTAQALQCSSDQGYVHGDVKPENILLDANGNAKLVDFGLAAMQKDSDEIWGTPYYISPERVRKEQVDFRADMYSLGGTLYHALTGVAPFEGSDSIEVVKARFLGMPQKPSEIRPELTPAIDTLVMKMLAMDKMDRYPSFEALIKAFKEVLTSGLTTAEEEKAPNSVTPSSKAGTKRITVRGRRTMMMKRKTVAGNDATSSDTANDGDIPPPTDTEKPENPESAEDDEEEGGNLGVKIALVIGGIVVAIGAIVGGLIWYQVADKKARAEETQQQIVEAGKKARSAISDTMSTAQKFSEEFQAFAQKAVDYVQEPTDALMKILPQEACSALKPPESKELLDAIAATNETAKVEEPSPATPPAATNAPAAKTAAATPVKAALPVAPTTATASTNAPATSGIAQQAVAAINELWNRAYSCQACSVRICYQVHQILKKGEAAKSLSANDRETVEKLASLSRELVEMMDNVRTSKDVENVRKSITYIKQKGEKTIEQTTKRLKIEKLENDRKARQEAAAAKEKADKEKAEAERVAKVEAEQKAATEKFDAIVAAGAIRQLDWNNSSRQLKTLKDEFVTPEGQSAADIQLRKIENMEKVQDIFVKSMKGFAFKGKLKGATVQNVSVKEITLLRNKKKMSITWARFFKEYPGNLNELINNFIVKGRENAKPKLNLKDWADGMTGAALILQLVCSEVNGATTKADSMIKEVVEKFPECSRQLREIFPNMDFEGDTAEEGNAEEDNNSEEDT